MSFSCGSVIAYIRIAFNEYITIKDLDILYTFTLGLTALFWTLRMKRCMGKMKNGRASMAMMTCHTAFLDWVSLLHLGDIKPASAHFFIFL